MFILAAYVCSTLHARIAHILPHVLKANNSHKNILWMFTGHHKKSYSLKLSTVYKTACGYII